MQRFLDLVGSDNEIIYSLENDTVIQSLKKRIKFLIIHGAKKSGKTTIAKTISKKLHKKGIITQVLDGDNIRIGINNNLSFSEEDRFENIRRTSEIGKLS